MLRKSLEWVGGSVLVYVLVAACSSAVDSQGPDGSDGGATASQGEGEGTGASPAGDGDGSGASSTGHGNSSGGSILDPITDPVPEAEAAEDGERIINRYITTSDGLKKAQGFWDTELEVECTFGVAEDGETRCLPVTSTANVSGYFSDSGCTVPVAAAVVGPCQTSDYAYRYLSPATCAGGQYNIVVYRLENTISSTVYQGTPGNCSEISEGLRDAFDFYSITKVPTSTFAEGSYVNGSN